jgi:hypothetical protein
VVSSSPFEDAILIQRQQRMTVDLKNEWGDADISALLASVKDDREWRLEIDANGVVSLHDMTANPTGDDYDQALHGYFEIWSAGTDFVGKSAAGDKELVGKIAKAIRENYPKLKGNEKFIYVAL